MKPDNLLIGTIAFVSGVLVGKNWNKIKNFFVPSLIKIKEKKFCHYCKTRLKPSAKFCYKCGKEL